MVDGSGVRALQELLQGRTGRCSWQSVCDDAPCGKPIRHELGEAATPHRVYSPYGDGRWREFDADEHLVAFGGRWSTDEVARMMGELDDMVVQLPAGGLGRLSDLPVRERHGSLEPASAVVEANRVAAAAARRTAPEAAIAAHATAARMTAASNRPVRLGTQGAFVVGDSGELVGAFTSSGLARTVVAAYTDAAVLRRLLTEAAGWRDQLRDDGDATELRSALEAIAEHLG